MQYVTVRVDWGDFPNIVWICDNDLAMSTSCHNVFDCLWVSCTGAAILEVLGNIRGPHYSISVYFNQVCFSMVFFAIGLLCKFVYIYIYIYI